MKNMSRKHKKIITKPLTSIRDITDGKTLYDYTVQGPVSCTLVFTGINVHTADITVSVTLNSPIATVDIIGIVLGNTNSIIHFHTRQIHKAPLTTSNLIVKSVLINHATFVYDGNIRVEKKAQKTDAYQRNENLFIDTTAHAESHPTLEILANDVRCTHGAASGPIPEEELLYLKSRGLSLNNAQELFIRGYVRSAMNIIRDEKIKYAVWKKLCSKL